MAEQTLDDAIWSIVKQDSAASEKIGQPTTETRQQLMAAAQAYANERVDAAYDRAAIIVRENQDDDPMRVHQKILQLKRDAVLDDQKRDCPACSGQGAVGDASDIDSDRWAVQCTKCHGTGKVKE